METIRAIGSISKGWTSTEKENGTTKFTVNLLVVEPYLDKEGKLQQARTLLIVDFYKKKENVEDVVKKLKAGGCLYVELAYPVAKFGTNPNTNNVYGYFYGANTSKLLFLPAGSENMISFCALGNLCADAKVNEVDSVRSAINFSLAANPPKVGETEPNPVFISCAKFVQTDKTGLANYLKKGQKIYVEGKPKARVGVDSENKPYVYYNADVTQVEFGGGSVSTTNNTIDTPIPVADNNDFNSNNDDLPF